MSAKATRAEKILDRLGNRLGLSDQGKQWLIAALDPFHDNPLDCTGYPDGAVSPCVTRTQKYTQTLGAPPGDTTANWDALILDTPHPALLRMYATQMSGIAGGQPVNNLYSTATQAMPFGGLWCVTAPAGSNFDLASVAAGLTAGTYQLFPLVIDPSLTVGDFRIIAKGFEVHNVTAELYKGGTVTVFESPVDSYETSQAFGMYNTGSSAAGANADVLVCPQWPASSTSAYSLVNSKQWEAKDGCYVTGRLQQTEIPIENGLNFCTPFYYFGESTSAPVTGGAQTVSNDVGFGAHGGMTPVLWETYNFTGAYFTGLANQTALTVNYLVILENHPSIYDQAIYSLAKPPPCRDDIALSMYSCILREMPVGVPVAMNGFGDWFADAVSNVADYVSPVLSAIPLPGTMAAGAALRAAGNVANVARGYPTNPNTASNYGALAPISGGGAASKAATKLKNAETRARNAEIKARNEAIRLKRAAKGM